MLYKKGSQTGFAAFLYCMLPEPENCAKHIPCMPSFSSKYSLLCMHSIPLSLSPLLLKSEMCDRGMAGAEISLACHASEKEKCLL